MTLRVLTLFGSGSSPAAERSLHGALLGALQDILFSTVELVDDTAMYHLPLLTSEGLTDPPSAVRSFREQVAGVDALLVAAPEVSRGLAGAVRNAFDWLSGTACVAGRPVGILGVSSDLDAARFARRDLAATLSTLGATVVADIGIRLAKGKFADGVLTDTATQRALRDYCERFLSRCVLDAPSRRSIERSIHDALGVSFTQRSAASTSGSATADTGSVPTCTSCGQLMELSTVSAPDGLIWGRRTVSIQRDYLMGGFGDYRVAARCSTCGLVVVWLGDNDSY